MKTYKITIRNSYNQVLEVQAESDVEAIIEATKVKKQAGYRPFRDSDISWEIIGVE